MNSETALLLVDIQNDFCPGGPLGVPSGDAIITPVNRLIKKFRLSGGAIFATRDWHPGDHCSFKDYGGIWPPHCLKNSEGAGFHPRLEIDVSRDTIISKGKKSFKEEYSGFDVEELSRLLKLRGVRILYTGGLATEYCVKATVMDGLRVGFKMYVLEDCVRPIDSGDGRSAFSEMRSAGVNIVRSDTLL